MQMLIRTTNFVEGFKEALEAGADVARRDLMDAVSGLRQVFTPEGIVALYETALTEDGKGVDVSILEAASHLGAASVYELRLWIGAIEAGYTRVDLGV